MSVLIPLSKVPGNVLLDVLPMIHKPAAAKKIMIPVSVVRIFAEECLHQVATGPGSKLTEVMTRLQEWARVTGRWTSPMPTNRQLAAIMRDAGIPTHRGHSNVTALNGWRLN